MQAANSHCPEGYLKRNPMRELALPGYSTPFAFPYFQVAFAEAARDKYPHIGAINQS
ncbi:hypothetical protein [Eikenella halliae]|uniref:hypothetical protein n=1 Tax=Eikenella halliae TaxID=1795832 RepID=UPI000AA1CC6B|nr:hypothetical protein [Eikenella halliae]